MHLDVWRTAAIFLLYPIYIDMNLQRLSFSEKKTHQYHHKS
jgi:hypothetical protein